MGRPRATGQRGSQPHDDARHTYPRTPQPRTDNPADGRTPPRAHRPRHIDDHPSIPDAFDEVRPRPRRPATPAAEASTLDVPSLAAGPGTRTRGRRPNTPYEDPGPPPRPESPWPNGPRPGVERPSERPGFERPGFDRPASDRPASGGRVDASRPRPAHPVEVRTGRPRSGVAGHRKPNHVFRLVGVFVLVVGTLAGAYLGFGRPNHPQAAGLPMPNSSGGAPNTSGLQANIDAAVASAQARASAAAASAAAQASHADQVAGRQTAASRSSPRPQYPVPSSCKDYTGNREIGCGLLLDAGFNIDQMPCLDYLWTKESHWNVKAQNASSGAYGIPQALPGDKMAVYGSDWQTNPVPQIKWGLNYIQNRYGTPCAAWDHSQSTGWY